MKTLEKIKQVRTDLSDYVFHFTKGRKALQTLGQILVDNKIKDMSDKGYICFTEAPLYSLIEMFEIFNVYVDPMYAPYAIGIPKEELYKDGGRPVIYGSANEIKLLDPKIHWRFEKYSNNHDFTWLREWRINKVFYELSDDRHFIITNLDHEALNIGFEYGDIDVEAEEIDGQYFASYSMELTRTWKSISIEALKKNGIKSNPDIKNYIDLQNIGDVDSVYLGSDG